MRQHRRGQNRPVGVVGGFLEHVPFGTDAGFQAHHDRFAERVDGRVGDLRELLPEIIVERTLAFAEHRHGGVVAHGTGGFLAGFRQRTDHLITLFEADLEELLVAQQILRIDVVGTLHLVVVVGFNAQRAFLEPLTIGVTHLETVVDIAGVQQLALLDVHGENLAGADTALGDHVFRLIAVHADLGGQGDKAVLGDHPAGRTQTVTVEHADRVAAVGHYQTGGAVPRLHVHGVIFVEGAQIRVHGFHVLPGRRHHHAHRAEQVHAAGNQHFQHVVHARGVGPFAVDQRAQVAEVGQQFVLELVLPRQRPVAVALDGVDLAIVGQIPERLGQRPLRRGVGGEPLVEDHDGGFHGLVAEIRIERRQVHRHHQAFIGDHRRGQGADVEVAVRFDALFRVPAGEEQTPVELVVGVALGGHQHLVETGQGLLGQIAQAGRVRGHFPPAQHVDALGFHLLLEHRFLGAGALGVRVGEDHPHGIGVGQVDTLLAGHLAEEGVGLFQQQTAAVTGFSIGINAAPVGHAGECFDRGLQELVAGLALHMGDQAETTVVPEFSGLIEPTHQLGILLHQNLSS